ncbi:UNVERIFIED_CONTAM: hypothetical protein K2H54_034247 [Gekko kuhli]
MRTDELVSVRTIFMEDVVVTLVLVLLVPVVCKSLSVQCPTSQPLPIVRKYYQSGDLLIAGIIGYVFKISDTVNFELLYGSDPLMTNKNEGAFLYKMFPSWANQYTGILKLLLYLRWIWAGVIYVDDEYGQRFVQEVLPIFSEHGVCFDFIQKFPAVIFFSSWSGTMAGNEDISTLVMESTAKAVVVHGEIQTVIILRFLQRAAEFKEIPMRTKAKVWILPAQMDFTSIEFQRSWDIDFIHGALSFAVHSREVLGFGQFLQERDPASDKEDGFTGDFWKQAFGCSLPGSTEAMTNEEICTGGEKLENLPGSVFEMSMTGHSYSIYTAVYVVAHALHVMYLSMLKIRALADGGRKKLLNKQPWQVMPGRQLVPGVLIRTADQTDRIGLTRDPRLQNAPLAQKQTFY